MRVKHATVRTGGEEDGCSATAVNLSQGNEQSTMFIMLSAGINFTATILGSSASATSFSEALLFPFCHSTRSQKT